MEKFITFIQEMYSDNDVECRIGQNDFQLMSTALDVIIEAICRQFGNTVGMTLIGEAIERAEQKYG